MLAGILGLGPGTREPSEVVVARQADIWIMKLHRKILQNHIKLYKMYTLFAIKLFPAGN